MDIDFSNVYYDYSRQQYMLGASAPVYAPTAAPQGYPQTYGIVERHLGHKYADIPLYRHYCCSTWRELDLGGFIVCDSPEPRPVG